MIPFDVEFVRVDTPEEAVQAWQETAKAGLVPLYYGGGTEFVTLAREHKKRADRLIDYKGVGDARVHGSEGDTRLWGSALRLNEIVDANSFGLLNRCCAGIADRTVRNSITLGGNIAGMLPYREAVLPFLLLDGTVTTVGPDGEAVSPLRDRFEKKIKLKKGELILAFSLDDGVVNGLESQGVSISDRGWGPVEARGIGSRGGWYYARRTKDPRLDYPLVTLVLARLDREFRLAVTGTFGYPYRATAAETVLNKTEGIDGMTQQELQEVAAAALDAEEISYKGDIRGGGDYRREMTILSLTTGLQYLSGATKGEKCDMKVYHGVTELVLTVNGEKRKVWVSPADTLLHTLRNNLGLTGTKLGCENGDCGACTVQVDGAPTKSCYTLAVDVDGKEIMTIEGLAESPVRHAFTEEQGFQCGFCTPGFVANADALLRQHPQPERAIQIDWLQSNICRCTGYESIQNAIHRARRDTSQ